MKPILNFNRLATFFLVSVKHISEWVSSTILKTKHSVVLADQGIIRDPLLHSSTSIMFGADNSRENSC